MTDYQKAIADRLARIAERNNGTLTPDAVVADARDKSSPLHTHFEWDDSEAAKQWRLEQARSLIRSVRVDVQTESRVISTVRYVRSPEATGRQQGYADVTKLRTRDDLAREALRRELASVKALFDRAESLAAAFDMDNEIVALRGRVIDMDERLQSFAPPVSGHATARRVSAL